MKNESNMLAPYPAEAVGMPGNVYRHTDGGYYRYLALSRDTEDQAPRVIYQHIWPFEESIWGRPASEWASRFTLIPLNDPELDMAMRGNRVAYQNTVRANKAARREAERKQSERAVGPESVSSLNALGAAPEEGR